MVDPTSDLDEDVDEADAPTCESCETPIVNEADHRVKTWIADGSVRTVHFCDETCREAWDGDA